MVKVIASSVRKGNVLDVDGKLYVVLTAQNFHPGKGTPVTQVDMRRISDGVKVSERYRTTEQVERAFVEDREHTFLYEDGEGFHFMNPETYDQLVMSSEDIGDLKAYLQEGMAVMLSIHEALPSPSTCRATSLSKSPRPSRSSRARRPPPPTSRPCFRTGFVPWCRRTSRLAPASSLRRKTAPMSSAPRTDLVRAEVETGTAVFDCRPRFRFPCVAANPARIS